MKILQLELGNFICILSFYNMSGLSNISCCMLQNCCMFDKTWNMNGNKTYKK